MFAELNEKQDRIQLSFPYDPEAVRKVKSVPGARFVPKEKGGPYWLCPLDLVSARRLRELFPGMTLGRGVQAWGKDQTRLERNLRSIVLLDDYPAEDLLLAQKLPELVAWFRPYQRADVKFLATVNTINGNEAGLGKTTEIIGAIYEANLELGCHLVVAPKTSLDTVWRYEYERWTDLKVITYHGDMTGKQRAMALNDLTHCALRSEPFVFACVADAVRKGVPQLYVPEWTSYTIDEFHTLGLTNISGDTTKGTQFGRASMKVDAERKWLVSGTPLGGRPIKLWGALHFLQPESYTSKWRWAEQWLKITQNDFGHKEIGNLLPEREEQFYEAHARHMVRRLKSEVLPQLPPKLHVDVWCHMTPKQRKQYEAFADDAEVRIDEERLSGNGILSEYARLKFFAFSACEVERQHRSKKCSTCKGTGELEGEECYSCHGGGRVDHLKLKPTAESGKLEHLVAKLEELGITAKDSTGDAVAVLFSQSIEIVDFVTDYLNAKGIKAEKITGATKQQSRTDIQQRFQGGGDTRVVCMTTKAGGVSITLDRADTVHLLDETWVPDDQDQAEDRIHRASRMHQVTCYYYRTKGTIEQEIMDITLDKADINDVILDRRRQGYRATHRKKAM